MCVSRLHQVIEVSADGSCTARDLDGRRRRVSLLAYEGAPLAAGDWIAVHSGYALAGVAPDEAEAAAAMVRRGEREGEGRTR